MDRFAVFVDAGYLYAGAGQLCHGTTQRHKLKLDGPGICARLTDFARDHCGLDHLRTYWYDGARDARPTTEHLSIANRPGVKLRLGRLTRQGQKGVDSRIVRDLIILGHGGGMATAYLLGGDEDLREGVAEAQEKGVRVVLLSIEDSGVSSTLLMEADDLIALDQAFLSPFLELLPDEAKEPVEGTPVEDGAGDHVSEGEADPRAIGRGFAEAWIKASPTEIVAAVRKERPRIPRDIDSALLRSAGAAVAGGAVPQEWRYDLRAGFWDAVDESPASAERVEPESEG